MELHAVPLHLYASLVPLIPDQPETLDARALLLARREGTVVSTDDPAQPTAVVVERHTAQAHTVTFAGTLDEQTCAAYIHALHRPVTLRATAALATRLHALHPDLLTHSQTTYMRAAMSDATFPATPPGGMRRLRTADARALTTIPREVWGMYGTAETALRESIIYARYLRAEIVSLACATARTERYAGIAAFTIERARCNGFARDCMMRLIGALDAEWGVAPLLASATIDSAARGLAHTLGLTEEYVWTEYTLR